MPPTESSPNPVPTPAPTFQVIYADPPWRYGNNVGRGGTKWGTIEAQYPTMALPDICALDVPAAPDSVLYLWATAPLLPEALAVMAAWGFKYKSCAVWDKGRARLGYWWRGQHELLLVGVRGKVSPPISSLRRSSVFSFPAGKHSAKPAQVRDYIASAFPEASRLEMFARTATPGWAVWGNEVTSDGNVALPTEAYVPAPKDYGGQRLLDFD